MDERSREHLWKNVIAVLLNNKYILYNISLHFCMLTRLKILSNVSLLDIIFCKLSLLKQVYFNLLKIDAYFA
jgi:hypothetical protein